MPRAGDLQQEKLLQWEAHAPQVENACLQQQRLSAAKNNKILKTISKLNVLKQLFL